MEKPETPMEGGWFYLNDSTFYQDHLEEIIAKLTVMKCMFASCHLVINILVITVVCSLLVVREN